MNCDNKYLGNETKSRNYKAVVRPILTCHIHNQNWEHLRGFVLNKELRKLEEIELEVKTSENYWMYKN